jgi:hypothetical protein
VYSTVKKNVDETFRASIISAWQLKKKKKKKRKERENGSTALLGRR